MQTAVDTMPIYAQIIKDGGPYVLFLASFIAGSVVLWKFIGTPLLAQLSEIVKANRDAMVALDAATQNTKDTASANRDAASNLAHALDIVGRFKKDI